jgi:hypothetical protein
MYSAVTVHCKKRPRRGIRSGQREAEPNFVGVVIFQLPQQVVGRHRVHIGILLAFLQCIPIYRQSRYPVRGIGGSVLKYNRKNLTDKHIRGVNLIIVFIKKRSAKNPDFFYVE